jgi:hypothetical protein
MQQTLLPDGKGGKKMFDCKPSWRVLISSSGLKTLYDMGFKPKRLKIEDHDPQRNAEQFTQSVFNSEEFSTPYESRGYGFQGRNALAENGMQIKDIGGYGQPNIEAESGEMVKTPEGFAQTLQGKTHEEGGIPLNLKPGTKIFSEHWNCSY